MTSATDTRSADLPGQTDLGSASPFAMFGDRSAATRFGMAAVAIFAVLAALSNDDGPVLCPLRRCSGGYCPGCGMTRSGGRLLRGDFAGSWAQHPYLLLAVGQLAVIGGMWTLGSDRLRNTMRSASSRFLFANVGLMVAIWVVRMTNGSIPIPFFS